MTIEFRHGPGVTEAEQCLGWEELAVTSIRAATSFGTSANLARYGTNVQGLRQFIYLGLERGVSRPELLSAIFVGGCVDRGENSVSTN
jgi:hypothetical protein